MIWTQVDIVDYPFVVYSRICHLWNTDRHNQLDAQKSEGTNVQQTVNSDW